MSQEDSGLSDESKPQEDSVSSGESNAQENNSTDVSGDKMVLQ